MWLELVCAGRAQTLGTLGTAHYLEMKGTIVLVEQDFKEYSNRIVSSWAGPHLSTHPLGSYMEGRPSRRARLPT